jgi:hypothetical protein
LRVSTTELRFRIGATRSATVQAQNDRRSFTTEMLSLSMQRFHSLRRRTYSRLTSYTIQLEELPATRSCTCRRTSRTTRRPNRRNSVSAVRTPEAP